MCSWERKALPLSHAVQKGPPCFTGFSERSLGVAGSSLLPRLGQRFMPEGVLSVATYQSQRLPVRALSRTFH